MNKDSDMNISFVFLRKKLISCIKNYLSVLFIYSHLPSSSSNAALASCHPHVSPFLSSEVPLAASLDTVTPISVSGCCHGNATDVPGNLIAE